MIRKDSNGEYTGVVYLRRNQNLGDEYDWGYVGCTLDLGERNRKWNNPRTTNYGGKKVMEARSKWNIKNFTCTTLETLKDTDEKKLREKLHEREGHFIKLYDTVNKGYNTSHQGTGNTGCKKSAEEIARRTATRKANGFHHTEATKKLLSVMGKGKKRSPEFCAAVSRRMKGIPKSEEYKKKLSMRMKGKIPIAAKAGADRWRELNGGSYWKGKKMSDEARANMKAVQQARGAKCVVTFPDAHEEQFPTMLDAAKALKVNVGSIASAAKTKGLVRNTWRVRRL